MRPLPRGYAKCSIFWSEFCAGGGEEGDVEKLEQLAAQIQTSSLCMLGKTAPNPVLSTLKHFRHEYEAHDKKCRVCALYTSPRVISSRPAIIFNVVVLPHPEGPRNTMNSLSLISKLNSWTTGTPASYSL